MISLNDVINNPWNIENSFEKFTTAANSKMENVSFEKWNNKASIWLWFTPYMYFFVWFWVFQTKLTAYWCTAIIYVNLLKLHQFSMEIPFRIIRNFSINNICIKFNGSKENQILLIYRIVFHWRDFFFYRYFQRQWWFRTF